MVNKPLTRPYFWGGVRKGGLLDQPQSKSNNLQLRNWNSFGSHQARDLTSGKHDMIPISVMKVPHMVYKSPKDGVVGRTSSKWPFYGL